MKLIQAFEDRDNFLKVGDKFIVRVYEFNTDTQDYDLWVEKID